MTAVLVIINFWSHIRGQSPWDTLSIQQFDDEFCDQYGIRSWTYRLIGYVSAIELVFESEIDSTRFVLEYGSYLI